jgi:L-ascorbate metabolism protein UlaG (beta-lactamase superfamily)
MIIKYLAHSGFLIESDSGIKLGIDLWLENPINPFTLSEVPSLDYVFITHDHADHDLDTAIDLAKRDGSSFISNFEIGQHAQNNGVVNIASGNPGGAYRVGDILVSQTQAVHSSNIGIAVGFIIEVDGVTIYHMGDTSYFAGLDTLGKIYDIDILLVPIGSKYTMGPIEASYAVDTLKPKVAIPMHYNTFDAISQDPQFFVSEVSHRDCSTTIEVLNPGDQFIFDNSEIV